MSNYWDFTKDKSKRRLSDLWRPYRDNHKYGFKDHKGNIVLPAQYNINPYGFRQGLSWVTKNNESFFINEQGEKMFDANYEWVGCFNDDGLAQILVNGLNGFINMKGEIVIEPQWPGSSRILMFNEGLCFVWNKEKSAYYCINIKGECVFELGKENKIAGSFSNGLAEVMVYNESVGNRWGYVDTKGNMVIPPIYEYSRWFHDGMAAVGYYNNDLGIRVYGFINTKGEVVIPFRYRDTGWFSEGLAPVSIQDENGKYFGDEIWGYINMQGEMVIAPEYDFAEEFIDGLAHVKKKGRGFYIDENAKYHRSRKSPELVLQQN